MMMTIDPRSTERREALRLDLRLPVTLEAGDGWTRDVSASGVYFETDAPLTAGRPIRFSFLLEHVFPAPLRLECEGQIVRVERREGKLGVAAAMNSYRLLPQEQHPGLWNEQIDDDRPRQDRRPESSQDLNLVGREERRPTMSRVKEYLARQFGSDWTEPEKDATQQRERRQTMKPQWLVRVMGVLVTVWMMSGAPAAWGDSVSINPSADSFVSEQNPTNNFGNEELLEVKSQSGGKNRRAILKFDLSSIPNGATITGASLTLFMEDAPGATRNYQLHFSSDDSWTEGGVTWNTKPALTSLIETIPTGTTSGVSLTWGTDGPTADATIKARVDLERFGVDADQTLTLQIKDSADNASPARTSKFTSKETDTENPIPVLKVDYTLPAVCETATIDLDEFIQSGPNPVNMFTAASWDIEYTVTAGCKALASVKTQGGIGGNLLITDVVVTKGSATVDTKPGKGANNVITWTISPADGGLAAGESVTLTATVSTGTNPKGKQEFTSCGIKPLTGAWSSVAVVDEDSSIIDSGHTDRLEVEVTCP